uniref:Cellulase n=1 Tax=Alexandrium andersonii TaxID=327968 RepID=A0A7S2EYN5_9DINO|mmetsp:Transcript_101007/g.226470  ORF Transcript_101007/g.226470 Transcript_101007/m.226470 type:complete len:193 (+) Transcript_101007:55-633(+)
MVARRAAALLVASALAGTAQARGPHPDIDDCVGLVQLHSAKADEGTNSSQIPIYYPSSFFPPNIIPVPFALELPLKINIGAETTRPPRPQLRSAKFWQPKYDPDWQPGATTHHGQTAAPRVLPIWKCEEIKTSSGCTQTTPNGDTCGVWGGSHCLPGKNAKCSDVTDSTICNGNTHGMSCSWNSAKGCLPSR